MQDQDLPPVIGSALYRMTRRESGGVDAVYVDEHRRQYELPFAGIHSPAGFEFGYAGSGPAELALSILAHHFELGTVTRETFSDIPLGDGSSKPARAWRLHQAFKDRFIASASREIAVFEISAGSVAAFVDEEEARRPPSDR